MASVLVIFGPSTFGDGSWFGDVVSGGNTDSLVCRAWIGGLKGVNGYGVSFRWCWNPGRCWKKKKEKRGVPFWVELTCLGAAIVWSFEDLIGSCAVMFCLQCWWLLRPIYLFVEMGLHWAWFMSVLAGSLLFALILALCFVWCLSRLAYIFLTYYHLMMGHNRLYACWCAGCAQFTRCAEGFHFLCCFIWIEVSPFVSKLVSSYTTLKQTFARWRIFVLKWRVHRFLQSRLLRQLHSAGLLSVLLGVLGPMCVLIGVGSYLFRLVCLMYFSLLFTPARVLSSPFCEIVSVCLFYAGLVASF